jgi:hypothetical protein
VEGGILDLPAALAVAPATLRQTGVLGRCQLLEGDALDTVPGGWNCYVTKNMLHGLTGEWLGKLLSNVREALQPGSRYIAIEHVIPEGEDGVYPAFIDIQMLVASGGRERTASEYRALLSSYGLELREVLRTATPLALLVAERR